MTDYLKGSKDALHYRIEWQGHHNADQTITQSIWHCIPKDRGLSLPENRVEALATSVTLLGGEPGVRYEVTNEVTFSNGGQEKRSITVVVS